MTEEEAKTKWCPMGRFILTPDTLVDNRGGSSHETSSLCIASECMAWRQTSVRWEYPHGELLPSDARTPEAAGAITVKDGCCGLVSS